MSSITHWQQITNSTGAETSPTVHDPPAVATLPTSCAAAAATAHPSTSHDGSVCCYAQHHVCVVYE